MLNIVYGCIVDQHDPNLLILAIVLCAFSCFSAVNLFAHAAETIGRMRLAWHTAGSFVFGSGVWATHFIAELAYKPGIPVSYDIDLTILSIALAAGISWIGLWLALRESTREIGGAVLGFAVVAMHYTGMAAIEIPAHVIWNFAYVSASAAIGILGGTASMLVLAPARAWHGPRRIAAASFLALSILGLHLVGMSGISLRPDPYLITAPTTVIQPGLLAITIAAASALIVALGLSTTYVDERLARQARSETAKLAHAQRMASIGFFERDLKTGHIDWSDEVLSICGFGGVPADLTRAILGTSTAPGERDRFSDWRRALSHNDTAPFDFRITRQDGNERVLHREVTIIRDERGKALRLFGTIQDITDRKARELELRRGRENLARAQRIAGIGSLERDLVTGELRPSDEFCQIYGLSPSELADFDDLRGFVHADDRHAYDQFNAAVDSGNVPPPHEFRITRADGTERVLYRQCDILFDDDRRPISVVATVQDVTQQHIAKAREVELAHQLEHSQRLEALGTLAGGMAHDINNTLVPIMAFSKMGMRRTENAVVLNEYFNAIHDASGKARDLIGRVLAFSRKDEASKSAVRIADTITDALGLLRATVPSSIKIETEIDDVPLIEADPTQIHQIITNLVSNAAAAIGDTIGTISVSLTRKTDDGGDGIALSVSDSGPGMDEATRRRIFEPFFTTKGVGEGTGLGLSIVHGIVASYRGRIEVATSPGTGTRFDIFLPVITTAAAAA